MVALAYTVAFDGIEARLVEVQCAVSAGMPNFSIVGLPDKAVSEARERVRAALSALAIALPAKRITVNMSPADMPKEGSHFDLPIALAVLAALEIIPKDDGRHHHRPRRTVPRRPPDPGDRRAALGDDRRRTRLRPVVPQGMRRRGCLGRRRPGPRRKLPDRGDPPLHRPIPPAHSRQRARLQANPSPATCATSRVRNAPNVPSKSPPQAAITC